MSIDDATWERTKRQLMRAGDMLGADAESLVRFLPLVPPTPWLHLQPGDDIDMGAGSHVEGHARVLRVALKGIDAGR